MTYEKEAPGDDNEFVHFEEEEELGGDPEEIIEEEAEEELVISERPGVAAAPQSVPAARKPPAPDGNLIRNSAAYKSRGRAGSRPKARKNSSGHLAALPKVT